MMFRGSAMNRHGSEDDEQCGVGRNLKAVIDGRLDRDEQ
jgi:hypothetical protein